jgi:hypothetical protein
MNVISTYPGKLPGGCVENKENSPYERTVPGSRFEMGTFRILVRSVMFETTFSA